MKYDNLGGFKKIDGYVDYKIGLLERSDKTMPSLFPLMFSERENVLFEETDGLRIKKITYGEAYDRVIEKSNGLKSAITEKTQAKPQAVVGLYMENSCDWIIAFWAILRAGFCPMLLNTRFDDAKTEEILREFHVVAVVSDGKTFSIPTILFGGIPEWTGTDSCDEFGEEFYVLSSGTSSVKICAYGAKELATIIENSRYVMRHNRRIKQHYHGQLKLLTFLPFYHIFGFVAVYLWFGFFSRTFVKLNDFRPQTILGTIRKHRVTHIFAVPLFWNTVYGQAMKTVRERGEKTEKQFRHGMKLADRLGNSPLGKIFTKKAFAEVRENLFGDSVRFMISGGSGIDTDVLRFFNNIGYHLANGYGMSEIGITSVELSQSRRKIVSGSVGVPLPSAEYTLREGILYVRGTASAKYVFADGRKTQIQNEWYKTCDLALYEKGCYKLLGRADDLIVSATGENLNPVQIEDGLHCENAKGICLIGGEGGGLAVLLVSVDRHLSGTDGEKLLTEIKRKITERKLTGQVGKIFVTTDDLIVGNEFKLNRRRLKADYESGAMTAWQGNKTENTAVTDELLLKVRTYFAVALSKPADEVGIDSDFFTDEGGSSLDYFALISSLQEDFAVSFPDTATESLRTVGGIAEYLSEKL